MFHTGNYVEALLCIAAHVGLAMRIEMTLHMTVHALDSPALFSSHLILVAGECLARLAKDAIVGARARFAKGFSEYCANERYACACSLKH